MTGTIKNIQDKGFGFIIADDRKEYFFHKNDFDGDWEELFDDVKRRKETVKVEFDPDPFAKKGPRASEVIRLPNE